MVGNTHIALGLLFAVGANEVLEIPVTPVDALVCVLGALFPDIDEPNSTISRPGNLLFPYIPRFLVKSLNSIARISAILINKIFGHRAVTHWPIIPAILLACSLNLNFQKLFMFALGYASHLIGDLCTIQGIPFYAPLSFKKVSLVKIKVGGVLETIISSLLWIGLVYYLSARMFQD